MTRKEFKSKSFEEVIKQIKKENQDSLMTKEEILSLIEKANDNGQDNFAKFLRESILTYPNVDLFIYSEFYGTMDKPRPVINKESLVCFIDVSLEECIDESGHDWKEVSACAESGTSEMVCKKCGYQFSAQF